MVDDEPGPDPATGEPEQATAAGEAGEIPTDEQGDETDRYDSLRFNRWMKRSATGALMTGIAIGLHEALELPKKEPAFVIKATGEPDGPQGPIDLQFDPDSPSNTVAVIRPWLADRLPVVPSGEDTPSAEDTPR